MIVANGGDPTDRVVRAVMPVSLRSPGDTRSNNQVSMIPVELPVGVADGKGAAGAVVRQTRQGKKSMVPMVVGAVNDTLDKILPAPIMEAMVPRFSWAFGWVSDTLVTNVRGPSDPYYFLGQEVLYVSPSSRSAPACEPWWGSTPITARSTWRSPATCSTGRTTRSCSMASPQA